MNPGVDALAVALFGMKPRGTGSLSSLMGRKQPTLRVCVDADCLPGSDIYASVTIILPINELVQ